jgi:predicted transcriptional regulator YdeE
MEPELRHLETLRLTGLVRRYDGGSAHDIPIQWGEFLPAMAARVDPTKAPCFGVSDWRAEDEPTRGHFDYWTAFVPPEGLPELPSGWSQVEFPECKVAVFVHRGSVSTFAATYHEVRGPGLGAAGLIRAHDFDIEYYPPGYDPDVEDGEIEIWIPVE